jgi:L-amino acid N-acyltransferase YncA
MSGTLPTGSLTIRAAAPPDAAAVAEIYNQGIAEREATFETEPRTAAEVARRIEDDVRRFPLIVAEQEGTVVGWASIGRYRDRALCRSLGFREVGVYEKHSRLDGRWLDVVIVERLIPENQP